MSIARWTAIALLSGLALAAAYLPLQPSRDRFSPEAAAASGPRARLDVVNDAYQRATDLLALTRFRDSLRKAVLTPRGAEDLSVVIRRALPSESQRALRAGIERVWRRAVPVPNVWLMVLVDPSERYFRPVYVFPSALDGRTCAVHVMLDWSVAWLAHPGEPVPPRATQLDSWLTEVLGPCLYYAAFGQPGPQVQRWLEERYFKVANTADWEMAPPSVDVREEAQAYDMIIGDMTFDALGCLNGELPRCREAVAHSTDQGVRFSRSVVGPAVRGVVRRSFWPRSFANDDHYLSALVHEMGHERFERFWRSRAPVDSAFESAFGQPLDVWTEHWARAFARGIPPFTPAPRGQAVFFCILTVVLGAGAAAALVARRQVG